MIVSFQLPENVWQKYEYLLEFAQWLYVHDFPTWHSLDLCQWAADLLLNLVFETAASSPRGAAGHTGGKKRSPSG